MKTTVSATQSHNTLAKKRASSPDGDLLGEFFESLKNSYLMNN